MGGSVATSQNVTNRIVEKKTFLPIKLEKIKELESLNIVDASVCFFSMEQPLNRDNLLWEIIKKGIFHHSGIIFEMSKEKLVLLEYGDYPHKNENENQYYYPLGNGLRYSLIDIAIIWEQIRSGKLLIINSDELRNYGSWCVKVKTRNLMTLKDLIEKLGNKWKKEDYNFIFNNCQDLTIKVINELDIESKFKSWYNINMQNHKYSKAFLYYLSYAYPVTKELAKRISNYDEIDENNNEKQ